MGILKVIAHAECDECGKQFKVNVDPASSCESWSVHDFAVDAVRGGHVEPERGESYLTAFSSVQNDKILCVDCTTEEDEK